MMWRKIIGWVIVLGVVAACKSTPKPDACLNDLSALGSALAPIVATKSSIDNTTIDGFGSAAARLTACSDVADWARRWAEHMRSTRDLSGKADEVSARLRATAEALRALIPMINSVEDLERLKPEQQRLEAEGERLDAEQAKLDAAGEQLMQARRQLRTELARIAAKHDWKPAGALAAWLDEVRTAPQDGKTPLAGSGSPTQDRR
jgi:hypothetical protein